MSDLNSKLRWLIALRLLVVVSISTPYALFRIGLETPEADSVIEAAASPTTPEGNTLRILVGLCSIQTLVFIACLRLLRHHPQAHAYLQFGGDLMTITLLLYRLGETAQTFSILYIVVISVASVLLRRSAGLAVATVGFALFAAVLLSYPVEWFQSRDSTVRFAFTLTVHLFGFYAIAFLTSYLGKDIAIVEERLRARDLDLASLEVVHRDVIQSISSGLVTTDTRGFIVSINKSAEEILEQKRDELVGVHVTRSGLFDNQHWDRLTSDSSTAGIRSWEVDRPRGDRVVHLGLTVTLLRDGRNAHRGFIVVVDDLTDERRLRQELRVKDRMAAIGEMAAGLAHEVGNPLAAISGSVQVLSRSLKGDAAQSKLLEITLKESQRLDRTVKSFLQLASSRQRRMEDVDIAAVVAGDVALLRNSGDVRDDHRIALDLVPESAVIRADPDQIGQIFWNLARNALQAMPDGGNLLVRGRLEGKLYRLEFHDTGSGMSAEEQADLFHPFKSFFDKGTGIGMAIVYRIVEEHGGTIQVESTPGEGTLIRVELPVDGPELTETSLEHVV